MPVQDSARPRLGMNAVARTYRPCPSARPRSRSRSPNGGSPADAGRRSASATSVATADSFVPEGFDYDAAVARLRRSSPGGGAFGAFGSPTDERRFRWRAAATSPTQNFSPGHVPGVGGGAAPSNVRLGSLRCLDVVPKAGPRVGAAAAGGGSPVASPTATRTAAAATSGGRPAVPALDHAALRAMSPESRARAIIGLAPRA